MDMHNFGEGRQLTYPVCETRDIDFVGLGCHPAPGLGIRRAFDFDWRRRTHSGTRSDNITE